MDAMALLAAFLSLLERAKAAISLTSNELADDGIFVRPVKRILVSFNGPLWRVQLGPVDLERQFR